MDCSPAFGALCAFSFSRQCSLTLDFFGGVCTLVLVRTVRVTGGIGGVGVQVWVRAEAVRGVGEQGGCNWPGGMVRHRTPVSSRTSCDIIVEHSCV